MEVNDMNFDDNEMMIEKINTAKKIKATPREMLTAILELQEKINEVIEVVNILTLPDDPDALEDDDEDDNGVVIVGKPVTKSRK